MVIVAIRNIQGVSFSVDFWLDATPSPPPTPNPPKYIYIFNEQKCRRETHRSVLLGHLLHSNL